MQSIVEAGQSDPSFAGLFTSFAVAQPQLFVDIDREKAKAQNVSLDEINLTLQAYLGSYYVNDFSFQGRNWQVNVQADPSFRDKTPDIGRLEVRNGAGDRVQIINKDCRHLQVPEDLPAKADLAVFELFDCSLIGEGVLHFLAYAREHLLASDAIYVPMAGRVRAMLIEYRLDRVWDIDANILNPYRFSPEFINVDVERIAHRPLSEPFDVFAFDFANASPEPQEREVDLVATADASVHWVSDSIDTGGPWHCQDSLAGAVDRCPLSVWDRFCAAADGVALDLTRVFAQ